MCVVGGQRLTLNFCLFVLLEPISDKESKISGRAYPPPPSLSIGGNNVSRGQNSEIHVGSKRALCIVAASCNYRGQYILGSETIHCLHKKLMI